MSFSRSLRVLLEQRGMINLFSTAFSILLYLRISKKYIEKLLLITSCSSLIADCMLIFTDGPDDIASKHLKLIQTMTFFEVIFWTIRELGLTLYTNRLIKILDITKSNNLYYIIYKITFILMCLWRLIDACLRTYDHYGQHIEGKIERIGDTVYLIILSALDMLSSIFLIKTLIINLKFLNTESNIYNIIKKMIFSGILRIVFINTIPMIRVIINQTISSNFAYNNDISFIISGFQASMVLMYIIDFSITKLDNNSIFKYTQIQAQNQNISDVELFL